MKRVISILLIAVLFAMCGLSVGQAEEINESDLIGTWQFVGGGEVMGDGFRLNADGTGRCLEAEYTEGYPKHLQPTDTTFRWQYAEGVFTVSFGRDASYDCLRDQKESDNTALEQLKPKLTTLNHIKYNFDILIRDFLPESQDLYRAESLNR